MNRPLIHCQLALLAWLTGLAASVMAQLPTADLTRMVPRNVRAGESVELNLIGQNLEHLTELRFTHPGITAQPVTLPADAFFPVPRISGSRFVVTAAEDVAPGIYEASAVGDFGLSTSRPFVVASADSREISCDGKNSERAMALTVPLNSVVSGEIPARGMHWFRFSAEAGQRVLLEVIAERIDSRLDSQLVVYDSDSRELDRNRDRFGRDSFLEVQPNAEGEFLVALSDILYRGGAEHFYRLRISDGPHVDFIWPPAGEPGSTGQYTLYGRNLPGGRPDELVQLDGHVLEAMSVPITLPDEPAVPAGFDPRPPRQALLPGHNYQLTNANLMRIGFATAPVVIEQESEEAGAAVEVVDSAPAETPQQVECPCEIAGRFDAANDEDSFRFHARRGTTYFLEVIADRMSSPVDSYITVEKITTSADGTETKTQVADNDDMRSFFSVDGKDSINADTTDSAVSIVSDHDGDYVVTLVNQFGDGGAGHIYRLAIREQTPDFQLIATTERPLPTNRTGFSVTPHLRRGARWGIRIICTRQDNFEGDIVVTAEDLPSGVSAAPLILSGTTDEGVLVVSADMDAKSWSGNIRIVGRAQTGEKNLVREARFACLVWGHIFADSIRVRSRLTEEIPLSINEYEEAPVVILPTAEQEWSVEIGQKLELPITVIDTGTRVGNLTIEPQGLFGLLRSPPTVSIGETETEGTLTISFAPNGNFQVKPGRYQFTLQGTGVMKYRRNLAATIRLKAEQERIERLAERIVAEAEEAESALEEAKKAHDAASKAVASATDDEARAKLQAGLDAAMIAVQHAEKAAAAAGERRSAVEKAQAVVLRTAQETQAAAAEKNTSFAAWSDLITVHVMPPKQADVPN